MSEPGLEAERVPGRVRQGRAGSGGVGRPRPSRQVRSGAGLQNLRRREARPSGNRRERLGGAVFCLEKHRPGDLTTQGGALPIMLYTLLV